MKDINKVRNKIGYITQFDDLNPKSTVEENFQFIANMIYSTKFNKRQITDIVDNTIKSLRLEKVRNTKIGNETIRGLSGGEKKRVSIGNELIGAPSLMFMDEPTTGLDASTALEVIEFGKLLANQNKTVITTIHQPSFEILECFDNILCLVQGHMVYWGPPRGIPGYFANIGLMMTPMTNPADYIMRIVNDSDILLENQEKRRMFRREIETGEILQLQAKDNHGNPIKDDIRSYRSYASESRQSAKIKFNLAIEKDHTLKKITEEDVKRLYQERLELFIKTYHKYKPTLKFEYDEISETKYDQLILDSNATSLCFQFSQLLKRNLTNLFREVVIIVTSLVLWVTFGFFNLFLFNGMTSMSKNTIAAISDRAGALFTGIATMCFIGLNTQSDKLIFEKLVFKRENHRKLYNPIVYIIANFVYDIPLYLIYIFIYINMYFWVTKLANDPGYLFMIHYLNMVLTFFAASCFGYILGASFDNVKVLKLMFPLVVLPFFVVAGFVVQVRSMGGHMFAISYLSFFKYGFQAALCIDLFRDDRYITYRNECKIYNEATETSISANYNVVYRCDAKNTYNFYENVENCEWLNMGLQTLCIFVFFTFASVIFYIRARPTKIIHHVLPKEIEENKSKFDGTGIQQQKFDWKKAEQYLVNLNSEEAQIEKTFSIH